MTNSFGINPDKIESIRGVFRHHPEITRVRIYGSRALGTNRVGSDIDLAIEGRITGRQVNQILSELDKLMLPYSFDLTVMENVKNKDLIEHIDRAGLLFYAAVRETTEQWDDVPTKVVGRRRMPGPHDPPDYRLQDLANSMHSGRVRWPKGVFRFRTHEEADAWWIKSMIVKK